MNGQLSFTARYLNGRTRLSESFFTPPFNLANIGGKYSEDLHLMLRSTSPGILDGDEYRIDMQLGQDANVILSTQSFQRLFDMKTGAIQQTTISLAAGASLKFIAQPAVPHENSLFKAETKICMHNTAKLIFGEILTCGRAMNGEHFKFNSYQSRTSICVDDKTVFKENLCIMPKQMDMTGPGLLEGYTHQASLTWVERENTFDAVAELIPPLIKPDNQTTWGMSRPAKNIFVLRLLGFSAYKLYDILQSICSINTKPMPNQ